MKQFAVASGVVLCAAMAVTNAHAADGRIVFTGMVVSPTCSPDALGNRNIAPLRDTRAQCPQAPSSTHYTLHVELATGSHVRLVEYYDAYVRTSGIGKTAQVATQTYE